MPWKSRKLRALCLQRILPLESRCRLRSSALTAFSSSVGTATDLIMSFAAETARFRQVCPAIGATGLPGAATTAVILSRAKSLSALPRRLRSGYPPFSGNLPEQGALVRRCFPAHRAAFSRHNAAAQLHLRAPTRVFLPADSERNCSRLLAAFLRMASSRICLQGTASLGLCSTGMPA